MNEMYTTKTRCIDSHQHFWQREFGYYTWLTEDMGPIYKDYLPEDLRPHLNQSGIASTVLVQAAAHPRETDYMLSLANKTDYIAAVIGWVDMQASNAPEEIARLANNRYFKGIRPMIQDIDDDNWMLNESLQPAFTALESRGLCFDALIKPQHLRALVILAKRYPRLKIVIDHAAKPNIAEGQFSQWAERITAFESQMNVYCKLSGVVTEAGDRTSFSDLLPYMQHIFDTFGPSRLMWGSDWPVLNLATDYSGWVTTCESFLSRLSLPIQQQIWSETATNFYNL